MQRLSKRDFLAKAVSCLGVRLFGTTLEGTEQVWLMESSLVAGSGQELSLLPPAHELADLIYKSHAIYRVSPIYLIHPLPPFGDVRVDQPRD